MSHRSSAHKKPILKHIFDALFTYYGPQHWWPGDSPFEIVVGAILTQNTNWRNVEIAIARLKKQRCLSPEEISHISLAKLGRLIQSAGFYNIKAKRLKEFVLFLMDNYDGEILKMKQRRVNVLRRELLTVRGIGPETCDSILLYALEKPEFVVDAYTRRILLRHGLIAKNATYEEVKRLFEANLKREVKLYNEYHALLVRLGKDRCKAKNPMCDGCPLEKTVGSRQ